MRLALVKTQTEQHNKQESGFGREDDEQEIIMVRRKGHCSSGSGPDSRPIQPSHLPDDCNDSPICQSSHSSSPDFIVAWREADLSATYNLGSLTSRKPKQLPLCIFSREKRKNTNCSHCRSGRRSTNLQTSRTTVKKGVSVCICSICLKSSRITPDPQKYLVAL